MMRAMPLPRFLPILALALAVGLPAAAQTAARKGAKPTEPLLTRAELRICFAQKDRIRDLNETLLREREGIDKEKSELVQLGATLKDRLAALDRTNKEAVDAFNADSLERDKRIDAFEARVPGFNEKVEALAKEREGYARQCERRLYDELDEIQIKRGK
jgi:uncharacterized coiled-coil protein SlyX